MLNYSNKRKDTVTKGELLEKLAFLPDDAEIHFSAWSYQEMEDGRMRQYSLSVNQIDILTHEDYAIIRLKDEQPEE